MKRAQWLAGGSLLPLMLLLTASAQSQPGALVKEAPAYLKVWVAPADGKLEVDGVATKSTGALRQFASPALTVGKKYYYDLKFTYVEDGVTKERKQTIQVEPGKEITVDLRGEPKSDDPKKPEEPTKIEPRKVDEPKKVEPKKVDEPKKVEPKKAEPKKVDEPKKVEAKKPEEKKEETIVVPYVPTPQEVVDEMLKLAGVKEGDVVHDLGCGDGRIVVTAVKKYKAKSGWGVDLNPERVKDSEKTAKDAGVQDKVKFTQGDVLKLTEKDISEANVVTLYLLPEVNKRLRPLLQKALKPGSRIVSHDFDMGDWKPEKEVDVKDSDGITHTIYLWTIPGEKKGSPKSDPKDPTSAPKKPPLSNLDASFAEGAEQDEKTIVVPYVPTPQKVVDEMLKLAAVKEGDVVYDLGCGDGRIVVTAVKDYKAKKGFGIDLNPERVKDSQKAAKDAGVEKKVEFKQGDVLKITDLSEANVVTLYLLPEVNKRLIPVLQGTLKPGSRVVSHDFDMGDWKAEKEIKVIDETGATHRVYLWTIQAKK